MSRKQRKQWLSTVAQDVIDNHRLKAWRNYWQRVKPKYPLRPHQTGRTHKRKPRGTRKKWFKKGRWANLKQNAPLVYQYLTGGLR